MIEQRGITLYLTICSHSLITDHHFGRAVIMFGIPYVYTQSKILKVFLSHTITFVDLVQNFHPLISMRNVKKKKRKKSKAVNTRKAHEPEK